MTAPTTSATPKITLDQRATSRHDKAFPDARFLLSKASGGRLDEFLAKQWLVVAER